MATKAEITGVVVSDKMDKSVVVAVERQIRDALYGKTQKRTSKFLAHNEANDVKIGDRVAIVEARPMSRRKRWVVTRVVEKAKEISAMIQMRSILDVADNSGARKIAAINPIGGSTGRYARLGDIITASVKEATPDGDREEGAGRQGGDRAHAQGAAAQGRQLHPVRSERGGAHQRPERADRHARVRAGGARAARAPVHEDHFAGARGPVGSRR